MKFQHQVVLDAPKEAVLAFLDDFEAAARCLPGLEDIKQVSEKVYDGRVRMKIGPLGLTIAGRGTIVEADADRWRIEGEGRDGRAGAGVKASLDALLNQTGPATTEVSLDAEVQFSGRLAEMGQPLIRRKANSLVEEFGQNLQRAIRDRQAAGGA